jgi:hypothetical protein
MQSERELTRAEDFRIINAPSPPLWRDPRRLAKSNPRNFLVAVISIFCGLAAILPPRRGYGEPISLQIARGEVHAWVIFALIGLAVLCAVPTLIRVRRLVSALFCLAVVGGLWALASTNPGSTLHLNVFVYLAGAILIWTWALWATLQDGRLFAYACMATLGALSCIVSFGIGERLMILSSLATLNTLLLSDLLE